jgi:hypothetical protein
MDPTLKHQKGRFVRRLSANGPLLHPARLFQKPIKYLPLLAIAYSCILLHTVAYYCTQDSFGPETID